MRIQEIKAILVLAKQAATKLAGNNQAKTSQLENSLSEKGRGSGGLSTHYFREENRSRGFNGGSRSQRYAGRDNHRGGFLWEECCCWKPAKKQESFRLQQLRRLASTKMLSKLQAGRDAAMSQDLLVTGGSSLSDHPGAAVARSRAAELSKRGIRRRSHDQLQVCECVTS